MSRAEYSRKWKAANPEKVAEYARRHAANPSRKEYHRNWMREYRKNNPGALKSARTRHLRKKYGLTVEQYSDMFAAQGFACAVCGSDNSRNTSGNWHTDHSHVTGKVRGILCHKCNAGLGMADDDPSRLDLMAQYLRHHAF